MTADPFDFRAAFAAADRETARENLSVRALRAELADLYRQVRAGTMAPEDAKLRLAILSTLAAVLARNEIRSTGLEHEAEETDPLNLRADLAQPA